MTILAIVGWTAFVLWNIFLFIMLLGALSLVAQLKKAVEANHKSIVNVAAVADHNFGILGQGLGSVSIALAELMGVEVKTGSPDKIPPPTGTLVN